MYKSVGKPIHAIMRECDGRVIIVGIHSSRASTRTNRSRKKRRKKSENMVLGALAHRYEHTQPDTETQSAADKQNSKNGMPSSPCTLGDGACVCACALCSLHASNAFRVLCLSH